MPKETTAMSWQSGKIYENAFGESSNLELCVTLSRRAQLGGQFGRFDRLFRVLALPTLDRERKCKPAQEK